MAERGSGGKLTPLAPGLIARAAQGIRYMVSGVTPSTWFGPDQPLAPQAQEVQGRQFDYPVGFNLQYQPRAEDETNISFRELRALADSYDLVRLVIETRKDQVERIDWNIKPRQKPGGKSVANGRPDPRVEKIEAFLQFPDGEHDFATWLRMLLEDMLVIDAACLYRRKNRGGGLYALDVIDGATIKRVLDAKGRTPVAPDVAYQQILKGLPAVDYTTEEMLYLPRNPRSSRVYGCSPCEQIVMTVNIGLRKQVAALQYWSEGNTPDALIGVPAEWTADQTRDFQNYWDALMSGNTAERRKARFIPGDMKYQPTKEPPLKDDFDEWLARIVCYAFSISPTAFTKQVNRATAETAKQAAAEEGLAPLLGWVKRFMDRILAEDFAAPDLEFKWQTDAEQDPLQQAQIDKLRVGAAIMTINEVRSNLGLDSVPDGDALIIETATGGVLLADVVNPPDPPPPPMMLPPPNTAPKAAQDGQQAEPPAQQATASNGKKKVQKFAGPIEPINQNRRARVKARAEIARTLTPILKGFGKEAADLVLKSRTAKADDAAKPEGDDHPEDYAALTLLLTDWEPDWASVVDPVTGSLTDMATDGALEGLKQVGVQPVMEATTVAPEAGAGAATGASTAGATEAAARETTTEAVNLAAEYARNRGAELVGKKWVDGELVDNPNADMAISDTTRDMLRDLVTKAEKEGWSNQRLAREVQKSAAFSADRAKMIARTETAMADTAGNMAGWRASGVVVGKKWLTSNDHEQADECDDNEDAGAIPLDDAFPSGADAPPDHVNCNCMCVPVTNPSELEKD